MKHRISIEVRVDGGIEFQFVQVSEGKENTRKCIDEAAQAILGVEGKWQYEPNLVEKDWPGMALCFTKVG